MIIGGHHLLGLDPLHVQLAEILSAAADTGFAGERSGNLLIEPESTPCFYIQGKDSPLRRCSAQPRGS